MRLPQPLLESLYFNFSTEQEFLSALGKNLSEQQKVEIELLVKNKLPPIVSREALSTMIGINPGFLWSLQHRTKRHYRSFKVKKGSGFRQIDAPKIALKIIQKWLSFHFERAYSPPDHVFGFVRGRSHILAAGIHCNASWVYSVDIKDFFPSTPSFLISSILSNLGYNRFSADMISSLCCLRGYLAQGAPSSPVLSNMAFTDVDNKLRQIAQNHSVRLTRYADDIVFSGVGDFPDDIDSKVNDLLRQSSWRIAEEKTRLSKTPNRLKVHGLLVHQEKIRLTKGYRNKIRAYRHILDSNKAKIEDLPRLRGHLQYAAQIEKFYLDTEK